MAFIFTTLARRQFFSYLFRHEESIINAINDCGTRTNNLKGQVGRSVSQESFPTSPRSRLTPVIFAFIYFRNRKFTGPDLVVLSKNRIRSRTTESFHECFSEFSSSAAIRRNLQNRTKKTRAKPYPKAEVTPTPHVLPVTSGLAWTGSLPPFIRHAPSSPEGLANWSRRSRSLRRAAATPEEVSFGTGIIASGGVCRFCSLRLLCVCSADGGRVPVIGQFCAPAG